MVKRAYRTAHSVNNGYGGIVNSDTCFKRGDCRFVSHRQIVSVYSENIGIKRKIPVLLWAECKNTKQPYGGKDSMENTDKNTFKNMMGKLAVLPESNIKIQSDDEFDSKTFRCLQRRTFHSLSKNKIVQSKKYRIGHMNYIVNSCFEIEPQNTVDNGIRYLLGMEMQDGKVS